MSSYYSDGFDLELISETEKSWRILEYIYKCPCKKGKVELTIENIPGYYDFYYDFNCKKCKKNYEILWGKGVAPGGSPMIRKIN
jgi:hypothetical protein